jgi:hypothetical protein
VTTTTLGVIVDVLIRVAVGVIEGAFVDVVDFSEEVLDVEVWLGVWLVEVVVGVVGVFDVLGVFGVGVGVEVVGVGVGVSAAGVVEVEGVAGTFVDGIEDVVGVLGADVVKLVVGVAATVAPVPDAEPVSCRKNTAFLASNTDA